MRADQRAPLEVKAPTAATVKAMKELDAGKGRRFESAEALFSDLNI
ncbi:MAG TPA: hypothetical protein VMP03_15645 [Methylomirabilota bacterium]|nr:hypothetical protein [Methylomirabilota bacterium]